MKASVMFNVALSGVPMKSSKILISASIIFIALSLSALALDVKMLTSDTQINAGEPVNILVRVMEGMSPVNNSLVNFTTDLGTLSSASNITNASGFAQVWVNSTIAGTARVNASSGIASNVTNISFIPLSVSSVHMDAEADNKVVANTINISFSPKDIYGNINTSKAIDLHVTINGKTYGFNVSAGRIYAFDVFSDNGIMNHTLISSSGTDPHLAILGINTTYAGNVTIDVLSPAVNSTTVAFLPDLPSDVRMTYNDAYTVNTSDSVYTRVYDRYDNLVPRVNLSFTVTSPEASTSNSPITYGSALLVNNSGMTDASGTFVTQFTTDKRAGANKVNATVVDNSSIKCSASIIGTADKAVALNFTQSISIALANNLDSYELVARPEDQFRNPIVPLTTPITELVVFNTTKGQSVTIPLNKNGQAKLVVGPTPYISSVFVEARYMNISGHTPFKANTTLHFNPGPLYSIDQFAMPDTVLSRDQRGNHESFITLVALDQWGHPLPGINVALNNTNTTVGTMNVTGVTGIDNITTQTLSNGKLKALFTGNVSGNTTIQAISGNISSNINIGVRSEPFMSVKVTVSPENISSGDNVEVTTILSIEGELPIVRPAANAMLVLDRSGSMDPDYYAGTPLDVVLVIDRSGSMVMSGGSPVRNFYDYTPNPMLDARESAKEFIGHLPSNARAALVSYSSDVKTDMPITLLNSQGNRDSLKRSLDTLLAAGATYTGEGLKAGNDILLTNTRPGSKKIIILLTDGQANDGSVAKYEATRARTNGIKIYAIGLGSFQKSETEAIAVATGGKFYDVPDSSQLRDVYNSIAQDISDYDVRNVNYGTDGFTPYDHSFNGSLNLNKYTLKFTGEKLYCDVIVNGNKIDLLNDPYSKGYEYDITKYVTNESNTVTFTTNKSGYYSAANNYIYSDYIYRNTYFEYSKVSSISVLHNGVQVASSAGGSVKNTRSITFSATKPSVSPSVFQFNVNETIKDMKVEVVWNSPSSNLSLELKSPSGIVYGANGNTTGYYPKSATSEYIWLHPLSEKHPDTCYVENGNWTVNVTGSGNGNEYFKVNTYIDKLSAAKSSSHAFTSSFDTSRGDKAGLALYSDTVTQRTAIQDSYVFDNSTWTGYFTTIDSSNHIFNVSCDIDSNLNVTLYEGVKLLDSAITSSGTCKVSSLLVTGKLYRLDVSKGPGTGKDTHFVVNVSKDYFPAVAVYYDSSNNRYEPRYTTWDGLAWSSEMKANSIKPGYPYFIELDSNPKKSEMIMVTGDNERSAKAQIWNGDSWTTPVLMGGALGTTTTRAFDVKYEQNSGRAIVVYMDTSSGNKVPYYKIWDGSSWQGGNKVTSSYLGSGTIKWVKLAARPNSNEMVLVTLDDKKNICAWRWTGSSWTDQVLVTGPTSWGTHPILFTKAASSDTYQCFDVVYSKDGKPVVIWAEEEIKTTWSKVKVWWWWEWTSTNEYNNKLLFRQFGGSSWDTERSIYESGYKSSSTPFYWVKAASDPKSNSILFGTQDSTKSIKAYAYNITSSILNDRSLGSSFSSFSSFRSFDVVFESKSGKGLFVYGQYSDIPSYITWSNSAWSSPSYTQIPFSDMGIRWVQLTPNPYSDDVLLMTSSGPNPSYGCIQRWSGGKWSRDYGYEGKAIESYECFDTAFMYVADNLAPLTWTVSRASVVSEMNQTIGNLNAEIDKITADGMTAIDEGMSVANSEIAKNVIKGNSTMVIMTDGIDNAGRYSMIAEAQRARAKNTTIYTIGFGNSEAEVDPVLKDIARITGGEYYFAPNSTVLKDIFKGIAMTITNFSASGPEMNLDVPYNYVSPMAVAKTTYITNSSNATFGNLTVFSIPKAPGVGNAEPEIIRTGTTQTLKWKLPTMVAGDKWGMRYEMKVEGSGYVPLILPTSNITYSIPKGEGSSSEGENTTNEKAVINIHSVGGTPVGGGGGEPGVLSYSLGGIKVVPDKRVIRTGDYTNITLTVFDRNGDPSFANIVLHSSLGTFGRYDIGNNKNPANITVVGSDSLNFTSNIAGNAYLVAQAYNTNNVSDVCNESEMILVRPRGMIYIE